MSHSQLIREQIKQVEAEPCKCIQCGTCNGSGTIRIDCPGWPEWDLETCDECCGRGIIETCDRCQLLNDMDYQLEEAERAER